MPTEKTTLILDPLVLDRIQRKQCTTLEKEVLVRLFQKMAEKGHVIVGYSGSALSELQEPLNEFFGTDRKFLKKEQLVSFQQQVDKLMADQYGHIVLEILKPYRHAFKELQKQKAAVMAGYTDAAEQRTVDEFFKHFSFDNSLEQVLQLWHKRDLQRHSALEQSDLKKIYALLKEHASRLSDIKDQINQLDSQQSALGNSLIAQTLKNVVIDAKKPLEFAGYTPQECQLLLNEIITIIAIYEQISQFKTADFKPMQEALINLHNENRSYFDAHAKSEEALKQYLTGTLKLPMDAVYGFVRTLRQTFQEEQQQVSGLNSALTQELNALILQHNPEKLQLLSGEYTKRQVLNLDSLTAENLVKIGLQFCGALELYVVFESLPTNIRSQFLLNPQLQHALTAELKNSETYGEAMPMVLEYALVVRDDAGYLLPVKPVWAVEGQEEKNDILVVKTPAGQYFSQDANGNQVSAGHLLVNSALFEYNVATGQVEAQVSRAYVLPAAIVTERIHSASQAASATEPVLTSISTQPDALRAETHLSSKLAAVQKDLKAAQDKKDQMKESYCGLLATSLQKMVELEIQATELLKKEECQRDAGLWACKTILDHFWQDARPTERGSSKNWVQLVSGLLAIAAAVGAMTLPTVWMKEANAYDRISYPLVVPALHDDNKFKMEVSTFAAGIAGSVVTDFIWQLLNPLFSKKSAGSQEPLNIDERAKAALPRLEKILRQAQQDSKVWFEKQQDAARKLSEGKNSSAQGNQYLEQLLDLLNKLETMHVQVERRLHHSKEGAEKSALDYVHQMLTVAADDVMQMREMQHQLLKDMQDQRAADKTYAGTSLLGSLAQVAAMVYGAVMVYFAADQEPNEYSPLTNQSETTREIANAILKGLMAWALAFGGGTVIDSAMKLMPRVASTLGYGIEGFQNALSNAWEAIIRCGNESRSQEAASGVELQEVVSQPAAQEPVFVSSEAQHMVSEADDRPFIPNTNTLSFWHWIQCCLPQRGDEQHLEPQGGDL